MCQRGRKRILADRLLVRQGHKRPYSDAVFTTLDHAYRSDAADKEPALQNREKGSESRRHLRFILQSLFPW